MLYALCSGLVFIGDARIVSESKDVVSYMSLAFLVPGLATVALKPKIVPDIVRIARSKQIFQMAVFSASYGFMAVTLWLAYQYGATASQMAPLRQSAVILTVLIAMVFLHERTHMMRKILAALLAIAAVYLISL
jgi:drug/metabolite transporter (DMT)-like permease